MRTQITVTVLFHVHEPESHCLWRLCLHSLSCCFLIHIHDVTSPLCSRFPALCIQPWFLFPAFLSLAACLSRIHLYGVDASVPVTWNQTHVLPSYRSRISSSFILSFTRRLSDSPVRKPFQKLWQFLHPLNTLIFHVSAVFSALNFSLPSSWSGEFLHVLEASSQSLPVLYVVPNTVSRCPLTTLKLLCVNREHGLFSSVSLDKLLAFVRCMPCSVHLYFHTAKFICRREGWHQLSML